jgi:hypothetical protein
MLLLASNYFDLLAIVVHGTFSFSFKFKYSDRARSTIHITNAGMLGHDQCIDISGGLIQKKYSLRPIESVA